MASFSTQNLLLAVFTILAGLFSFWATSQLFSLHSITEDSTIERPAAQKHISYTTAVNTYCGVPPTPDPRVMEQPDGSSFEAYIRLQSNVVYLETLDGFTIMKDPSDDVFRYSSRGKNGDLALSGVAVHERGQRTSAERTLLQAIPKHLRFTGSKLAALENSYQLRDNDGDVISAVFPPAGVQRSILLLIDFPDQLATYTVNDFDNLANQAGYSVNGASGSFREYYEAISYGLLSVNTDVEGWYTAVDNRSVYGVQDLNNRNYDGAVNLVREAVDAAEAAGVDFSQYDGDGDGRVDVVEVIHSGRGTEESGDPDDIWSHRWALSARGLSITYDGVLVNDYIMQAEKYGSTNITNIGVLVHEFGHALGLPDLYDTNGGSSGLGRWCCMAGGTWNNSGKTPAHFSAWCKEELGWTAPTVLSDEGSISNLEASETSDEVYRIDTPNANEYFLLENRQKTGWDAYLPGEGLMIYHIDDTQSGNANEDRPKVGIEQGDGNGNISSLSNNGDNGDPFPGSTGSNAFNCSTSPNSNNYGGDFTNINVSNISNSSALISFDYGYCSTECNMQNILLNGGFSNLENGTYDQSFIISYGFPPVTGTLDITVAGITRNEAITGSPQTVVFTGLPANGQSVNASASFSADPDCALIKNNLYLAPRDCSNDNFCDALAINSFIDGEAVSCSNIGATTQNNEPRPNGVGCSVQDGWCENGLSNTVWFKFNAPASGSIDIDFLTPIDLQMAVWEVNGTCSDLGNSIERLLVAANDDDGSAGGYSPRIQNLRCLVPGKEYFIQLDGWNGATGNFAFEITDPGLSCAVAPIASASCDNTFTSTSSGNGTWIHLSDSNGNRIASVNDQFNDLGTLSVSYSINDGMMRMDPDNFPLLDRDWFINAANNNGATVRLYLTDSEYQHFINEGGISTLGDLTLLKVIGGTCGNFNDGSSSILDPIASKLNFNGNNHMLEFRINSFSGFFPRSNAAILPIELLYFKGNTRDKSNLLEWASSLEENTKIHEIERLLDHSNEWEVIGQLAAAGNSQSLVTYQWEDHFPLPLAYYRIKTIDSDGSFQYSDLISLKRESLDLLVGKAFPNPTTNLFTTDIYASALEEVQYSIININGQLLQQQQTVVNTGVTRLEVDLNNYPPGIYLFKLSIGEQQFIQKILKE